MNLKEIAEFLDGREYGNELPKGFSKDLKDEGFIVMFGQSDDTMVFEGAIEDERGYWKGNEFFFSDGQLMEDCSDDCKYSQKAFKNAKVIQVTPCPWRISTDIPHEKFRIMEDGEEYGEGIVFHISSIQ